MLNRPLKIAAALLALMAGPASAAGSGEDGGPIDWHQNPVRLMLVDRVGCIYCEAWEREIGPGYATSPVGRTAPLLRVDIDGPYPDGLALARRPTITPTFVVLKDGIELDRMEGYPGPRYFYPVLSDMMAQAGLAAR